MAGGVSVKRDETAKKKPRGKPFQKGNKLGGRPAIPAEVKEFAQCHSLEALEFQVKTMRNDAEDTKYRLMAANAILDRGYGKPTQPTDITFSDASDADLIERAKGLVAGIGQERAAS